MTTFSKLYVILICCAATMLCRAQVNNDELKYVHNGFELNLSGEMDLMRASDGTGQLGYSADFPQLSGNRNRFTGLAISTSYRWHPWLSATTTWSKRLFMRTSVGLEWDREKISSEETSNKCLLNAGVDFGYTLPVAQCAFDFFSGPALKSGFKRTYYERVWYPDYEPNNYYCNGSFFPFGMNWHFGIALNYKRMIYSVVYSEPVTRMYKITEQRVTNDDPVPKTVNSSVKDRRSLSVSIGYRF